MLEGFRGVSAKEIDQAERFLKSKRRLVAQLDTARLDGLAPHRCRLALIRAETLTFGETVERVFPLSLLKV